MEVRAGEEGMANLCQIVEGPSLGQRVDFLWRGDLGLVIRTVFH